MKTQETEPDASGTRKGANNVKNKQWKRKIVVARGKWKDAAPVILFFLFLFYTILALWGTQYIILVSMFTTTFKIYHQKPLLPARLARLVVTQAAVCLLGAVAGWNAVLCVALDLTVPFLLVYLHSTQFEPAGYFVYAMGFVFLQLRPVAPRDLPALAVAIFYCEAVLVGALVLYGRLRRPPRDYREARRGLRILSRALERAARGENCDEALGELLAEQQALHRLAYASRSLTYVARGTGQMDYMLALLLQRGAYFLSEYQKLPGRGADREVLLRLSALLTRIEREMDPAGNETLLAVLRQAENTFGELNPRVELFVQSFLRLLRLSLKRMAATAPGEGWRMPRDAQPLFGVRQRLRPERFEIRFALRLSLVITVGFLFCRLTGSDHVYWLPLNAFLLLQPMYEDSAYRVKTRLVGTAVGALLCYAVLPLLPGITGHFLFATAMVVLMYSSTPGKWVQPIFSTGFALALTTMTMDSATAVELRLLYLTLAVVLVLAVNRFFFPTSRSGQLRENLRELVRIQRGYMDILTSCTRRQVDYGAVSAMLNHFHLVCAQIRGGMTGFGEQTAVFCRSLLELMWRMASEAEQMVFLVRSGQTQPEDLRLVEFFALQMRETLERLPQGGPEYPSGLPGEMHSPNLRRLAERYDAHLIGLAGLWPARPAELDAERKWWEKPAARARGK